MDLKKLLEDYRNGKLTDEQKEAFEQLLHSKESEATLQQLIDESLKNTVAVEAEETQKFIYQRIRDLHIKEESRKGVLISFLTKPWLRYAAIFLLLLGAGSYLLLEHKKKGSPTVVTKKPQSTDIAPGHDGAMLTLADGTTVDLDTLHNGVIARQNGAAVVLKNGSVAYNIDGSAKNEIAYNIISTPKGRQFQIVLPDGSKVWLNAASSIRYPTVFTGSERKVEIEGEAYFEVSKNKALPFKVIIQKRGEVEVLGTHFNINAYYDEAEIKTTLLEGRVKVSAIYNPQSAILKPGEQVLISQSSQLSQPIPVQTDEVMAWKNGLFNFNGYDIKAVMRELGRWYDLDIVYESEPEATEVMGELQRSLTLSQVMKVLQRIHLNYRIEGRKLIIMK